MSTKAFADAVYAKATTANTFNTAVGGRISHGWAKEEESRQYATFIVVPTLVRSFSTIDYEVEVQWNIWGGVGDGPSALMTTQGFLYTLFEGVSLTVTGFDRGLCTWNDSGTPMVEDDLWRVMSALRIRGSD